MSEALASGSEEASHFWASSLDCTASESSNLDRMSTGGMPCREQTRGARARLSGGEEEGKWRTGEGSPAG